MSRGETDFSPIDGIGLELTEDAIRSAFAPFVAREVEASDPEWRSQLAVRKRRIVKKGLRRLLLAAFPKGKRREADVHREYSGVWSGIGWQQYSLETPPPRYSPWEWRGRRMLASTIGATRFRQLILVRLLEHLRPRSVLELGCGNGINLLLLAGRFPEVSFTGLELTHAGNDRARAFQERETLCEEMAAFAPLPIEDRSAFKRIDFVRGSAAELPFADGSFDLVYSVLALEQMERIRATALAELARVARRSTFMIEPFRDVNRRGWPRWNVLRRDYFRGSIAELGDHGLKPIAATDDFPQETFLRACAVLCEKA